METWDPQATVGYWINRASRSLVRRLDGALRPFGFALSHLPVLRALADGSSRSQTELARLARVEQPSMAETLARMERDGVLRRAPDEVDRRALRFSVTPDVRRRFAAARRALVACEREVMAGLSAAERAQLRSLLERVVANLETGEAVA